MRPNRSDVLAALGWRGQEFGADFEAELSDCMREIESAAKPRFVSAHFVIEPAGFETERDGRTVQSDEKTDAARTNAEPAVRVCGTSLVLPGRDITALLADCRECILMCATLGFETDRLIAAAQTKSPSRALLLDACASAAIESFCDEIQDETERREAKFGRYLTFRYAPGYGDLPIGVQRGFLNVLNAGRRIGVFCGESLALQPRKSVTAVLGITETEPPKPFGNQTLEHSESSSGKPAGTSKCSRCPNYPHCAYRKEGSPCE